MKFRPCIDIHDGKVKQIVGGTLSDNDGGPVENFISDKNAACYAELYKSNGLSGGHIVMLNPPSSPYYEETKNQVIEALRAYPDGMQTGGGITPENAGFFLDAGASHVIVTSYVFKDGAVDNGSINKLTDAVPKNRLVFDLSCRKKNGLYYIVTDRWQKFTDTIISHETLDYFAMYCDEFLIHAADVEGKSAGVDEELIGILGSWGKIPLTYAGGVASYEDIEIIKKSSSGKLDFTVGSALNLFGGPLEFEKLKHYK